MDSTSSRRALRIAIAEDSRAQRLFLVKLLERLGHAVVCAAENGEELRSVCAGIEFDLAIIDLDMPVVDGLTVAEELWLDRKVPIILVSAHSDLEHVNAAVEPVSACVPKPISIAELEAAIDNAIRDQNRTEPAA
jgi:response regulator NasT